MLVGNGVGVEPSAQSPPGRTARSMRYDRRMTRPNLFGQERAALAGALHELGEPAYRTSQVYSWLYNKRARSFAEMTNVGKDLRQRLGEAWDLRWPEGPERSLSYDGTRKYLF